MTGALKHSIAIAGLGRSGIAAARLLLNEGSQIHIADQNTTPELRAKAEELEQLGAKVVLDTSTWPDIEYDYCVASPGIKLPNLLLDIFVQNNIPIISELEVGWRRIASPVIAVSGSNGKSTTVKVIAEVLRQAGHQVWVGGNIGTPVCELASRTTGKPDWTVLEVSSFQLETTRTFRAEVGILLNVQPNHLDRHGNFETYQCIKSRLFENTHDTDICIIDNSLTDSIRIRGNGRMVTFGDSEEADYSFCDGSIWHGGRTLLKLSGSMFDNIILGKSVAAIAAFSANIDIAPDVLSAVLTDFSPLPHRFNVIDEIEGITFINDSKATSLTAMMAALERMQKPTHLIAGGIVKETVFSMPIPLMRNKVKCVYLIGKNGPNLADAWSNSVPCRISHTLQSALADAWSDAQTGETILLSPGCASFDQFRDYEERGTFFNNWVKVLASQKSCTKMEIGELK